MRKKKSESRSPKGSSGKERCAKGKGQSKYLFLLFFLAILVLAILIVRPYLSTLIVSAVIAYVLYPVYGYFYKHTRMKGFSAAVLIVLLILLLSIPVVVVAGEISTESYGLYQKVKTVFLESGSLDEVCVSEGGIVCGFYDLYSVLSEKYDLDFHLARAFSNAASGFVGKASNFLMNIPNLLLHVFIAIFAMFYMFVQGEEMIAGLKKALPLSEEHSRRILKHFNDIIYATIYGAIIIAIVQGVVAGVGYYIFGVTSPLIMTLLTVLASFIPFVGAALVWVPVSLIMVVNGAVASDNSMILKGAGLFLFGALIVSMIDNVLRPKIVGDRAKVHPLVILLGVFGGLALFGFAGILIGPLLLSLFIASLKIYEQEKENIR